MNNSDETGTTNLQEVLSAIQVSCDDIVYGYATIPANTTIDVQQVLGTFRETEGLTVFSTTDYLDAHHWSYDMPLAKLTIEIHTSLELVGLTAALATKLTEFGISANVVAAYFHDHIFVPYTVRDEAIKAIESLRASNV